MKQDMTFKEDTLKNPTYKILVVDDEEEVRKLVAALLSKRGHYCSEAAEGVDALDKVVTDKFDAVITDIVMPKMDGITLTRVTRTISQIAYNGDDGP